MKIIHYYERAGSKFNIYMVCYVVLNSWYLYYGWCISVYHIINIWNALYYVILNMVKLEIIESG